MDGRGDGIGMDGVSVGLGEGIEDGTRFSEGLGIDEGEGRGI